MIDEVMMDWNPEHHARATDPVTSHEAAEKVKPIPAMEFALRILKLYPGSTANELEMMARDVKPTLLPGSVRKRLSDLRNQGLARNGESRQCSVSGMEAQTWWAN